MARGFYTCLARLDSRLHTQPQLYWPRCNGGNRGFGSARYDWIETTSRQQHRDLSSAARPGTFHEPPLDACLPRLYPIAHQPENPKSLSICLVGPANAGKSTLLNHLLGSKVSITSSKAQTTRSSILGILTDTASSTQLVFLDSPGLAPPRQARKLHHIIADAPWTALSESDLILFMVDATNMAALAQVKHHLKRITEAYPKPMVLLFNKTDLLSQGPGHEQTQTLLGTWRKELLAEEPEQQNKPPSLSPLSQQRTDKAALVDAGSHTFSAMSSPPPLLLRSFGLSAKTGQGVARLKQLLLQLAKPKAWHYGQEQKGLLSDVDYAQEIVREKVYRRLNQEIPYEMQISLLSWQDTSQALVLHYELSVKSLAQKKMVIGSQGSLVTTMQKQAQEDLELAWNRKVIVYLHVKVGSQQS